MVTVDEMDWSTNPITLDSDLSVFITLRQRVPTITGGGGGGGGRRVGGAVAFKTLIGRIDGAR